MHSSEHYGHVRRLFTLSGLALAALALGVGAYATFHGSSLLVTYATAFLAWWGYLVAHKAVTGQFIDNPFDTTSGDSAAATANPLVGLTGIVALVSGMVVGALGIRNNVILMSVLGGVLFVGGYVIAHYGVTGKIL